MEAIIQKLKVRSGQSEKFTVVDKSEITYENQIFEIIFLASFTLKIGLVIRNTDATFYKISKSKSFFAQNLEYVETKDGIHMFRIPLVPKTILKPSKKTETGVLQFSNKEKKIIEQIEITKYVNMAEVLVVAPDNLIENDSSVLSLFEFLQKNPKDIKSTQYVEVICHL